MRDNDDLTIIVSALRAGERPLDEVARRRMQARLFADVEQRARQPRRRFAWWAFGRLVAPVVAVAVALVLLWPKRDPGADAVTPSFTRLEVPAGAQIDTGFGGRARIRLVGPAVVEVMPTSSDLIAIRLSVGILVGDYDHRAGGKLRIDSPGASTEIVGTRFAIEASADGSRVSVAHGRVKVRGVRGRIQDVSDAQSWTSGHESVETIAPAARALFDKNLNGTKVNFAPTPSPLLVEPVPPTAQPRRLARSESLLPRPAIARREAEPRRQRRSESKPPARTPHVSSFRAAPPAKRHDGAPVRPLESETPVDEVVTSVGVPETSPASPPAVKQTGVASARDLVEGLYASAESAMKRGDLVHARAALEQVVRSGSGAVVTSARFDLARLAVRRGDREGAAKILDDLLAADPKTPLRAAARLLRCRLDVERGMSNSDDGCRGL